MYLDYIMNEYRYSMAINGKFVRIEKSFAMSEDEGWTRELGGIETAFYQAYQKGILRVRYWMVLNSKEPLQEKDIKTTLGHLCRLEIYFCCSITL